LNRPLLAVGGAVLLGIGVLTVASLSGDNHRRRPATVAVPTEQQARQALADLFQLAQLHDRNKFCAGGPAVGICLNDWQHRGGNDAVPKAPPTITAVRVQDGYRVLTVCGKTGLGDPYDSDFPVGLEKDKLVIPLPLFWSGHDFSGSQKEGQEGVASSEPVVKTGMGCS
jgi:hypothetical protein